METRANGMQFSTLPSAAPVFATQPICIPSKHRNVSLTQVINYSSSISMHNLHLIITHADSHQEAWVKVKTVVEDQQVHVQTSHHSDG